LCFEQTGVIIKNMTNTNIQIKELLEIIKHKLDNLEFFKTGQGASISLMRDQLSMMNSKFDQMQNEIMIMKNTLGKHTQLLESHTQILESHTQVLESHTRSLVNIENKINIYDDMYKTNDTNVRKLEKRVDLLEEDAGVETPPELKLADVN
jgi:hypothetical protein